MVYTQQLVLEGKPTVVQVSEVKPGLKKVEVTPTSDDLKPVILKVEEQ
jgi:hypothetical protein